MAKAGVYKIDVKRARDALISRGERATVGAVRAELGNTGSNSTIHRYLKELEVEDQRGALSRTEQLAETLAELVHSLAAELDAEASHIVNEVKALTGQQLTALREQLAGKEVQLEAAQAQVEQLQSSLGTETAKNKHLEQLLQEERLLRHTAQQEVAGLKERVREHEQHRTDQEAALAHARQSLEHFRAQAQVQREQAQRDHNVQIQHLNAELRTLRQESVVKQGEVTRLNMEAAVLAGDVANAQRQLREEQARSRDLEMKLENRQAELKQIPRLEGQLEQVQQQLHASWHKAEALTIENGNLAIRITDLSRAAMEASAKVEELQSRLAAETLDDSKSSSEAIRSKATKKSK